VKPSEILDEIGKLNDEDANLLLISLSYGMHDEWDCSIEHFFSVFGPSEFTIAAKAGAYCARAHEEDD